MPEGDSYTRARRRIAPILIGRTIERVQGSAPDVRRHSSRLLGATVETVRTHGKHLMIDCDVGLTVHVHLGMPGRIRVGRSAHAPPSGRGRPAGGGLAAVRMGLGTELGTVWVLSAPDVDVDRRAVIDHRLRRLGADVLATTFDWARFETQSERYPADRTVSDFLLDQRVMAGIGNEYKCEVLFLEGIDPRTPMSAIDAGARRRLAERARAIMLPNAERPQRTTTGRRHPDSRAWVFERAGRACRRCGTVIEQARVGNPARITYWCPDCQM